MSGRPDSSAGRWISFEGIEGCGKTTQLARLHELLVAAGVDVVATREPGGTRLGRRLRSVLLEPTDTPMDPSTELLLYAADRAQHLVEVVLPALERGAVVLCDRFLDATVAYQGHARGLGADRVLELHRRPPLDRRPDRTVLVDLDPAIALTRARGRDSRRGSDESEGRFELEADEFHARVRAGYLTIAAAEPQRVKVVDGRGDVETVGARVVAILADLLPEVRS